MKLALRNKRLTGKFHFTRWGIIALVVLVALGSIGVTYARIKGPKPKDNPVITVTFSDPFTWVVSNDDGTPEDKGGFTPIDPGDDGGGTEYDLWGTTSSDDPSEPQTAGQTTARYDKDVASTTATLDGPQNVDVIISNAYPSYYPTVFFGIINDGNISGEITSISIDENYTGEGDVVADDIPALTVTAGGISVGQMINVGEEVTGNLAIHVEQEAQQNWVYHIRVKIVTSADSGECDGKVTKLTLQYNGAEPALIEVREKKTGNVVFEPQMVQPGEEFTFSGSDKNGTLGTEIWIFVNDELAAKIHTSCSKPIGPGLVVGDFEVIAGESRFGGPLGPITPVPEGGSVGAKSEGGVTLLTLKYNGAAAATVTVREKKNGKVLFGPETVPTGGEFTFSGTRKNGTLGKDIWIYVNGDFAVKIKTSGSQPIGPGLVVGDFEVVYGESRRGGILSPLP